MIIIAANEDDPHARRVVASIRSEHDCAVTVVDTSAFPLTAQLSARFEGATLETRLRTPSGQEIDLDQVRSFWWRRPQATQLDPRITDLRTRSFTLQECESALYGLLHCCDGLWVNDLEADQAAEYKPLQLKVAAAVGMSVPTTLMSNDPQRALEFFEANERHVIFKAFNQRGILWCPTRLLGEEELPLLGHVRQAPVIFQRYVPGIKDIRVTVIGELLFATEFSLEESCHVDHRVDLESLTCSKHDLPDDVAARILRLMKRLRLEYGGVDFRITPEGEYVFFEVNTAGEFTYLETRTGQPISQAMADHLARGERVNDGIGNGLAPGPCPVESVEGIGGREGNS